MGRRRVVYLSLVNITLHPHSFERYESLFKMAEKRRLLGKIWSKDYG